jgi:hypothetical protein
MASTLAKITVSSNASQTLILGSLYILFHIKLFHRISFDCSTINILSMPQPSLDVCVLDDITSISPRVIYKKESF